MSSLKVVLVTPEGTLYDGEAHYVNLPGSLGSMGIYPLHAAMVTTLQAGTLEIAEPNQTVQAFEVNSGVVEVLNDKVTILVEA